MRAASALRILVLAAAASGCASDPCDGVTGVCLSARVEGAVSGLDQLRISVDALPSAVVSPSAPSAFSLPVRLAVVFPPSAAGTTNITIEGLQAGRAIATTGRVVITIPSSGRFSRTFTLGGGGGDGGGPPDLAGSSTDLAGADLTFIPPFDLAGGGVTATPSSFTFQDTLRGTLDTEFARFTIRNNTSSTVSGTPSQTGDSGSFPIDPSTTCPAAGTLAGNSSCDLVLTFRPQKSGSLSTTFSFNSGGATLFSITATGRGVKAWSAETTGGGDLRAVWGSSPSDVHAGGIGGSQTYHSTGDGTWTATGAGIPAGAIVNAIGGFDANNVWAGADGKAYLWSGTQWSPQTTGFALQGTITGIALSSASTVWATSDSANTNIYQWRPGIGWSGIAADPTPQRAIATGSGLTFAIAVGDAGELHKVDTASFVYINPTFNGQLRGVWMQDSDAFWVAAEPGSVGSPAPVFACRAIAQTCATQTTGDTGKPEAISGRIDPGTGLPDIYIAGYLGNHVLHSTGNGTWTAVTIPNVQTMLGVWVAANGDVYAVGVGGAINHYY